jgi:hypothetical protein
MRHLLLYRNLIEFLHLRLGLPSSDFPIEVLYAFLISATSAAHPPLLLSPLTFMYVMTLTIFDEEHDYKTPRSICYFLLVRRKYCKRFDQRVARQQLYKQGPTSNNKGLCVFRVLGDVTQRWVVVTWHVFPVMCVRSSAIYKWQNSFGSGTSHFSVGDSHGKFVV